MSAAWRWMDVGTSVLATLARGGSGLAVGALGNRPEKTLILYDFEGCPFCRKVREALSILDLEAEIPSELYKPIAEILSFVYRINQKAKDADDE
mgnify:CR=1 FL=1